MIRTSNGNTIYFVSYHLRGDIVHRILSLYRHILLECDSKGVFVEHHTYCTSCCWSHQVVREQHFYTKDLTNNTAIHRSRCLTTSIVANKVSNIKQVFSTKCVYYQISTILGNVYCIQHTNRSDEVRFLD